MLGHKQTAQGSNVFAIVSWMLFFRSDHYSFQVYHTYYDQYHFSYLIVFLSMTILTKIAIISSAIVKCSLEVFAGSVRYFEALRQSVAVCQQTTADSVVEGLLR